MKSTIQGKLETAVMNVLWDKKDCSPREVLTALKGEFALTTISTILERLYEKGLLKKDKTGGRVRFSPKVSQKKYSETVVNQFMGKVFDSFGNFAVSSFAKGIENLPDDKKKELIELLKEYEK